MINPQWLELPISWTNCRGSKYVRAIEVRLYMFGFVPFCLCLFLKHSLFNILHPSALITKTCLYNYDPLKPHFYIVKLGFTGVYIIFPISSQNHRLWVFVSTASARRSNEYPQSIFEQKYEKCQSFFIWKNQFLELKIAIYFNTGVYIIFPISSQNHRLWVFVSTASARRSNEYPQSIFEQKYEKCQSFFIWKIQFLELKIAIYFNRRVFVMHDFWSR